MFGSWPQTRRAAASSASSAASLQPRAKHNVANAPVVGSREPRRQLRATCAPRGSFPAYLDYPRVRIVRPASTQCLSSKRRVHIAPLAHSRMLAASLAWVVMPGCTAAPLDWGPLRVAVHVQRAGTQVREVYTAHRVLLAITVRSQGSRVVLAQMHAFLVNILLLAQ